MGLVYISPSVMGTFDGKEFTAGIIKFGMNTKQDYRIVIKVMGWLTVLLSAKNGHLHSIGLGFIMDTR